MAAVRICRACLHAILVFESARVLDLNWDGGGCVFSGGPPVSYGLWTGAEEDARTTPMVWRESTEPVPPVPHRHTSPLLSSFLLRRPLGVFPRGVHAYVEYESCARIFLRRNPDERLDGSREQSRERAKHGIFCDYTPRRNRLRRGHPGVHEVPVDFYEGGPRGHGGSDPLGGRRSKMRYAILLMTVPWPKPFKFKAQPDPQWLCSLQTSFLHFSIGSFDML